MSLVLWKPKDEILKVKEEKKQEEEQEHNKKRNGLLVAEPGMDVEMWYYPIDIDNNGNCFMSNLNYIIWRSKKGINIS